jgi:hypothetical protein
MRDERQTTQSEIDSISVLRKPGEASAGLLQLFGGQSLTQPHTGCFLPRGTPSGP